MTKHKMNKTALADYLLNIKNSLSPHFAPGQVYHGKEGALRLARELGYGLKSYPSNDVEDVLGTLYSTLLVKYTFGTSQGVPISNKEFIEELNKVRLVKSNIR